jgi:serine O-acetyltransferase
MERQQYALRTIRKVILALIDLRNYYKQTMLRLLLLDYKRYKQIYKLKLTGTTSSFRTACSIVPTLFSIVVYRYGYWMNQKFPRKTIIRYLLKAIYQGGVYFSVILAKAWIPYWNKIGPGLFMGRSGRIILGAEQIGTNCTIHHNVTIGMDNKGEKPVIGDHVWIGPDTIIYGNIRIGNGATICHSTVLSKNVPNKAVVSGNPAKIIIRDFDNQRLHNSPDPAVGETLIKSSLGDNRNFTF